MTFKKSIIALLLISFSLNLFAQDLTPDEQVKLEEKSEVINNEVLDQLTANDALVAIEESKSLILNDDETDWDIIKSIPKDAWELVKSPAGWSKKEWFIASGVVTMSTLLMTGDAAVRDFFQRNKTEFTTDVAFLAEKGGSQAQVGLAATYLVGTILKNKKLKKASLLAFSSLLVSGVLVQGLKKVFSRTRPYAAENQWEFGGPSLKGSTYNSFPSGHTTSAFAVAASIATIYDSKLVKILAYSAATLTGISRIHDNKHWMSDVFMGAIIGTVTGIFITKRHMNSTSDSRFKLNPAIMNVNNQTGYGLSLTISLDSKKKKRKK